jgi:hypothetical protein
VDKWAEGAKKEKNADKEAKRQEQLARKAEAARLLAEEEASVPVKKPAPKAGKKKDSKPAGPGAIAAGNAMEDDKKTNNDEKDGVEEIPSYSASGLDNALDLLEVVTSKMDKASIGQQAAGIEKHPEVITSFLWIDKLTDASFHQRRFKAISFRSTENKN